MFRQLETLLGGRAPRGWRLLVVTTLAVLVVAHLVLALFGHGLGDLVVWLGPGGLAGLVCLGGIGYIAYLNMR